MDSSLKAKQVSCMVADCGVHEVSQVAWQFRQEMSTIIVVAVVHDWHTRPEEIPTACDSVVCLDFPMI